MALLLRDFPKTFFGICNFKYLFFREPAGAGGHLDVPSEYGSCCGTISGTQDSIA
jgi:hypothetical protein